MSQYKLYNYQQLLQSLTSNMAYDTWIKLGPGQLNNLIEEEKKAFCLALEKNTVLHRLDLSGNALDDIFLNNIKEALLKNKALVQLDYDKDAHNPQTILAIQELLVRNRKNSFKRTSKDTIRAH